MVFGIVAAVSAILALTSCVLGGGFSDLSFLWQLPLNFVWMFLSLVVLVFLFVVICCACVDMKKVQEKDSPFYRFVLGL